MYVDRHAEIVNAVNEARRITSNWLKSLQKGDPLSLSPMVVAALRNMVIACEGDVPEDCRHVYLAVRRVGEELHQYIQQYDGKINPNGSPVGSFWASVANLEAIADKVDTPHVSQLESVKELRTQKVSNDQVAFAIYGYRGKGPFVTSNGLVNVRLLDMAAESIEKQNEILKDAGWPSLGGCFYPPWMQTTNSSKKQETADRLAAYKILEEGPKQYEDPASIEEMLLANCYVQQIERGKHVTRNEVLAEATRIGVKAIDQPGWTPKTPLRDIPQPEAKPEVIQHMVNQLDPISSLEPDDRIRQAVEACAIANPTYGPAEILADVSEDGLQTGVREINKILKDLKKSMKQTS